MKSQLFIVLIFLGSFILNSQSISRTLNVNEGLSSSFVRYITSDDNGLIWIGTDNGLDRYDGNKVVNYANRFNIPLKGAVQQIVRISEDEFLVATEQGAFKYSISKNTIIPIDFQKPGINVRTICKGIKNKFYFGTDKGLYEMDKDTTIVHKINLNNRIVNTETIVTQVKTDKNGHLWIASLGGLYIFNPESRSVKHFPVGNSYFSNNLHCILQLGSNTFLGTENGLYIFDSNQKIHTIKGTESFSILSICENENKIYLGTENQGLKIYNLETGISEAVLTDRIGNSSILSIHSSDNNLWLGTFNDGVIQINLKQRNQFRNILSGKQFNFTPRSYLFHRNQVIVGTRDGLAILNNDFELVERIKPFSKIDFNAKVITCIAPYPAESDKLLLGTYEQSALIFDLKNKSFKNFHFGNFPSNISIYKFLNDNKGNLWIATLDGLIRYTIFTKQSTKYNLTKALQSNEVFSLDIDHSDRLWIGTKLGICYLDLKTHRFYKPVIANADKYQCTSIYSDSRGKIWFCFNKGGVLSIDNNFSDSEWFTEEIGIPQNAPSSVIEDTNGNIWIGSQKGLFKITNTGSVLSYNTENGLTGIIFTPESAFRDKSGNLWWLNESGFVKLAAKKSLNPEQSATNLLFTQLIINGTAYSTDTVGGMTKINNRYVLKIKGKNNNHLGFEFSLVNHINNKQNRYTYKMQGLDSVWSKPGSNNQIEYAELGTGKHLLEVKASSDEEGKITQKASLEIHIIPYFYETTWFILILAALLMGTTFTLTWSYFKILIKKLSQQFTEVRQKTEKSVSLKLSKEKCKHIQESLQIYMMQEKPYLRPDFKIAEAAKFTGYGLHEISYVLNSELNTNFADYINSFRVEELLKMMSESLYEKYTLSAIAEKCGFNSKTTFYRAFKKYKGISPSEYFKRSE